MAENEAGLFLGAVDLTVTYLASWPLIGIRNRLQVGVVAAAASGCTADPRGGRLIGCMKTCGIEMF